ncbi:MAG: hypothetical protein A2Y40_00020 [Candidatus Margulisbacteria bacterium GWF2_35_9]|nr:MAG: hypothetical protein A2Y40_00020 [Candidatus Margulisbacteria bacterium GWF2_35_9]
MEFTLNKAEQTYCLNIARDAIQCKLNNFLIPPLSDLYPNLQKVQGIFVTLTLAGRLRGCIGNIIGQHPLHIGIQKMALQAAFHDPRFIPLSVNEFNNIHIEISVLSPLFDINYKDVVLGKHGLLITYNYSSGVFLPQVPIEQNWSETEYLEGLCNKAGLPKKSYLNEDCKLQAFTAFVFGDDK